MNDGDIFVICASLMPGVNRLFKYSIFFFFVIRQLELSPGYRDAWPHYMTIAELLSFLLFPFLPFCSDLSYVTH